MAFPFLIDETFDDGTRGTFDSETDASSILDFPSYKALAQWGMAPWQGSHALRASLNGTATAYVEDGGVTGTNPISVYFPLLIGADITLSDGDVVHVFQIRSTDPNPEAFVAVRRTGDNYELVAGEGTTVRRNYGTITRSFKRWYQIELTVNTAGTLDWYVDGGLVSAQVGGLSISPFTVVRAGAPSGTAAGVSGTILIGRVIADDVRVFPRNRFPGETIWVTRDINAYIGSGTIDAVQLTGTSTNAVLTILDTDVYNASDAGFNREPKVYVRNVTIEDQSPGFNVPVEFHRGAYVQLTGTNPQAWISLGSGSIVQSHAGYVDRARKSP